MLVGSSLLLVLLIGLDLRLSHLDGVILLLVLVGYLWVVFLQRKGVTPAPEDLEELAPATAHPLREGFRLMLGLASIGMASHLLILSASAVAGVLENLEIRPAAQGSLIALAAMTVMTLVFLRSGWQLTRREGIMLILVGAFRWALDFTPHFQG